MHDVRTYGENHSPYDDTAISQLGLALLKEIWEAQGSPSTYSEELMVNVYQLPSAVNRRRVGMVRRRLMDGGYIDFFGDLPNIDVAVSKRGFVALRKAGIMK